ncbi:MAG: hypothetical protein V1800_00520 [Candidatus Latescibacterota bacterium]
MSDASGVSLLSQRCFLVVILTTVKVHDVNILDQLIIELGAIYIKAD